MTQAGPPESMKMEVVVQVTHVRCNVMYRCECARHCAVETDAQQGHQRRVLKKQTRNPLSHATHVTVARRQSCDHTAPRQQSNLRMSHFHCSQNVLNRNRDVNSPTVYESPGPDHGTRHARVVNTVLSCSNELHHHQRVCTKSMIPW